MTCPVQHANDVNNVNSVQEEIAAEWNRLAAPSPSGPITAQVSDISTGRPAIGVRIIVYGLEGGRTFTPIAEGRTDENGKATGLLQESQFHVGTYKLKFGTGEFFMKSDTDSFYPYVEVTFQVRDPSRHHHIPLSISPFGYSTHFGN